MYYIGNVNLLNKEFLAVSWGTGKKKQFVHFITEELSPSPTTKKTITLRKLAIDKTAKSSFPLLKILTLFLSVFSLPGYVSAPLDKGFQKKIENAVPATLASSNSVIPQVSFQHSYANLTTCKRVKTAPYNNLITAEKTIHFKNSFDVNIDTNAKIAFAENTDLVENSALIDAVKSNDIEAVEIYVKQTQNKDLYIDASRLAINLGHLSIAKLLFSELEPSTCYLYLIEPAIKAGHLSLVEYFITNGAFSGKEQIGGRLFQKAAHKFGFDEIMLLFSSNLNPSAKEIFDGTITKLLTHIWETKKVSEKFQNHQGGFQGLSSFYMQKTIREFSKKYPQAMNEGQAKLLLEALNNPDLGHYPLETEAPNLLRKIKDGEAVNLFTSWVGHAVTITIKGNYLMFSNRGEGTLKPIDIFKINPELLNEEIIKEFQWENIDDYHIRFPATLSKLTPTKDEICLNLEKFNPLKEFQLTSNCAWESPETAIFGLLSLENLLSIPKNSAIDAFKNAIQNSYQSYNGWLQYTKVEILDWYFTSHENDFIEENDSNVFSFPLDLQLIEDALTQGLEELPQEFGELRLLGKRSSICSRLGITENPVWIKDAEEKFNGFITKIRKIKEIQNRKGFLNNLFWYLSLS